MYDVVVIGAGINGTCSAYMLEKAGLKTAVLDGGGIASGGSGAAGAFLSPKFSKEGELKNLLNNALDEALTFYTQHFALHLQQYPLLHIAKDAKEAEILRDFKRQNPQLLLKKQPPFIPQQEYIYTDKSAIVDAQAMCHALLAKVELYQENLFSLEKDGEFWLLNSRYKTRKVLFANGAYNHNFFTQPYKTIRGIWGHRIDISTTIDNFVSVHQFVSISPTDEMGKLSIGATHNVHYHPQISKEAYDFQKGRQELLQKARKTLPLGDVEVLRDYVGLRSGSVDYMPLVGKVVDVERSLRTLSRREIEQKKPDFSKLSYVEGLYQINGSAGYGFVLAPTLAQAISALIVHNKEVDAQLNPARFFYRWAKRTKF